MMNKLPSLLAKRRLGRAVLHIWCLFHGGNVTWHLAGIRREILPRTTQRQALSALTAGAMLVCCVGRAAESAGGHQQHLLLALAEKNVLGERGGGEEEQEYQRLWRGHRAAARGELFRTLHGEVAPKTGGLTTAATNAALGPNTLADFEGADVS